MDQQRSTGRFTLTTLVILVTVSALQTAAYAEFGLIDWLFANGLLLMVWVTTRAVRHKRWRSLTAFLVVCVVLVGAFIPGIPAMERVTHQIHMCTKCRGQKDTRRQAALSRGFRLPSYVANDGSRTSKTTRTYGAKETCTHVWVSKSSRTTRYSYLFGLRLLSGSEVAN